MKDSLKESLDTALAVMKEVSESCVDVSDFVNKLSALKIGESYAPAVEALIAEMRALIKPAVDIVNEMLEGNREERYQFIIKCTGNSKISDDVAMRILEIEKSDLEKWKYMIESTVAKAQSGQKTSSSSGNLEAIISARAKAGRSFLGN